MHIINNILNNIFAGKFIVVCNNHSKMHLSRELNMLWEIIRYLGWLIDKHVYTYDIASGISNSRDTKQSLTHHYLI